MVSCAVIALVATIAALTFFYYLTIAITHVADGHMCASSRVVARFS